MIFLSSSFKFVTCVCILEAKCTVASFTPKNFEKTYFKVGLCVGFPSWLSTLTLSHIYCRPIDPREIYVIYISHSIHTFYRKGVIDTFFKLRAPDLCLTSVVLGQIHMRYSEYFRTRTRLVDKQARQYLEGLLVVRGRGNISKYANKADMLTV